MSSRSSVEKTPEPVEALPITTVVADSLEAVERLRTGWIRLRRSCALVTPNADPDRYLATLRGLGRRARPYVAMLHGGAETRALMIGRERVRPGRIRLGYLQVPAPSLRSLDTVYGGLITDDSQQAVRAVVDHLRRLIDTGRFEEPTEIGELATGAAHITACTYQAALGAGAVDTTLHRDLCESKVGWLDYGSGDSPYRGSLYVTESWNETTVHLYAKNVRASSARVVHRVAVGLPRRASAALARGGRLARVKKRWRGRLAMERNSSTMARGRK